MDDPDDIKTLELDRSGVPLGHCREVIFDRRQVFDIDIWRVVTEYSADVRQLARKSWICRTRIIQAGLFLMGVCASLTPKAIAESLADIEVGEQCR